ncbi:MAG: glycosyltransferase family 4 protein [Chloroflexi bacterium]|nr:glycosyltransferase family 4 protein [Chloroflexota bacterium]
MKVALVTKPDKQMTGLRRYAESLYQGLQAKGVDVALVLPQPPPEWVVRLGQAMGRDAKAFFASYPLAVRLDDASLCHLASQTLATLLLFQPLPRTVVTVLDLIPHLVRDNPALSTYRTPFDRLFDRLALYALRRADRLIAISHYTKRCLVEAVRYPPERIHVVHCAVDREQFKPLAVPKGSRQKYGLDESQRYILYVGSEDPRKNVGTLIQAFHIVQQQVPSARLIKAGAAYFPAQRQKLQKQVAELGLEGKVLFLDHVPDEDLPLLYNAADVFVLPSLYEGFGLPALEALSCGTPVVAANRASLPEVVGEGGVLVEPMDAEAMAQAMVALLSDPQRRAAASQAALRQAERFSLQRQAEETLAVYEHEEMHVFRDRAEFG